MATTRHQRRKNAQKRALAKAVAIAEASKASDRNAIVKRNLQNAKPERNYYVTVRSCLAGIESMSHRGYICRASGAMSKRGADALRAKGSWKG